jgi:hypothetical protein
MSVAARLRWRLAAESKRVVLGSDWVGNASYLTVVCACNLDPVVEWRSQHSGEARHEHGDHQHANRNNA